MSSSKKGIYSLIFICLVFYTCAVRGNFFKQFEDYIAKEESRRAQDVLESDLLGSTDSPKEIEIHCPQVTPSSIPVFDRES